MLVKNLFNLYAGHPVDRDFLTSLMTSLSVLAEMTLQSMIKTKSCIVIPDIHYKSSHGKISRHA